MRLARILYILFPLALAAADDPSGWAAAKWGMTPDQVKTAVPEAHELSGPTPERTFYVAEEKKLATVGVDHTDIGGTPWKVFFGFEGPKGLTGVWLTPAEKTYVSIQTFQSIESLLVQKYGRPFERQAGSPEDSPSVTTALWSFPKTTIELRYVDFRARIPLESLYLTYRVKSTDLDKL